MDTVGIVFILISAFACLTRINSLEYSDLETLGFNCSRQVSCALITNSDFYRRNCECDRNCVIYQDCCVDARVRAIMRSRMNSTFTCMPLGGEYREVHTGAYVVQTCSRNYNGPSELQRRCQNQNNISDPIMSAPVTDTFSDTTYRNRYCAECNNVDVASLQSWLIQLNCTLNASDNYIWQNLQYRPTLNKWGVDMNGRFHTCDLFYEIPTYLQPKIRLCRSFVVSTCPRTWSRPRIKELCESYTAVAFVDGSAIAYKNPHCAICNGLTVNALKCVPGGTFGRVPKPFSFALLLDVNQSDGDVVGVSRPRSVVCGTNQKYDPYFKKCRNLVCALPGYQMVNGKCKKP